MPMYKTKFSSFWKWDIVWQHRLGPQFRFILKSASKICWFKIWDPLRPYQFCKLNYRSFCGLIFRWNVPNVESKRRLKCYSSWAFSTVHIARFDDYFLLGRELSEFLLLPLGSWISARYFKFSTARKKLYGMNCLSQNCNEGSFSSCCTYERKIT